jgi:hypothetical protein
MTHRSAIRPSARSENLRPTALLRASLAAGCVATLLLGGCADPELERRAAVQTQLEELGREYTAALGGSADVLAGDAGDEAIAKVRAVASKASQVNGSAAQTESARRIAASASRAAAELAVARASAIEGAHEAMRGVARDAMSLAADLDALAQAADAAAGFEAAEGAARRTRDAAAGEIRAQEEAIAAAAGPMDRLARSVEDGSRRLAQLEQEIAVLLRKARESNPATGFAFVEEATSIRGDARAVRAGVDDATIDAEDLAVAHGVAETRLAGAQGVRTAATAAGALLSEIQSEVKGSADKTRALANDLRREADSILKAIDEERTATLAALYEAAANDLSSAESGAGSDQAMRHALTTGNLRLAMSRLAGMGADGRMRAALGQPVADLRTEAESLIAAFKERATAAADEFSTMGDDPSVATMKAFVDGVKSYADGLTVATLMDPPAPAAKGGAKNGKSGASGRSTGGGDGASGATPDQIIAKLLAFGDDEKGAMDYMIGLVDDSNDLGKAMKSLVASLGDTQLDFNAAMREAFGEDASLSGLGGGGMGSAPSLSADQFKDLSKVSDDGETAVYSNADGSSQVTFVKVGGAWRIDLLGALRGQMPPEMMEQMGPMLAQMMSSMGPAMKKTMSDIAARVRAGEFATAEEAAQALGAEVAKSMGGGLGGGLRGRGGFGG